MLEAKDSRNFFRVRLPITDAELQFNDQTILCQCIDLSAEGAGVILDKEQFQLNDKLCFTLQSSTSEVEPLIRNAVVMRGEPRPEGYFYGLRFYSDMQAED